MNPLSHSLHDDAETIPAQEKTSFRDSAQASLFDVCRCPKCQGPMTARMGKAGPYYHCLCFERSLPYADRLGRKLPAILPLTA